MNELIIDDPVKLIVVVMTNPLLSLSIYDINSNWINNSTMSSSVNLTHDNVMKVG